MIVPLFQAAWVGAAREPGEDPWAGPARPGGEEDPRAGHGLHLQPRPGLGLLFANYTGGHPRGSEGLSGEYVIICERYFFFETLETFMLLSWCCPFKPEKDTCRQNSLSKWIDWCQSRPPSVFIYVIYDERPPHIWWKYLCIASYIIGALSHIWLCTRSRLNFLIYEESFVFFFISAVQKV